MWTGLYARVSAHDQQTLPLQLAAMRDYVAKRGWKIAVEVQEVGSGAILRSKREELLKAARRRELDRIVVWRLDRWGCSNSRGAQRMACQEGMTSESPEPLAGRRGVPAQRRHRV
jgi:DNA invertase Pin-like site-specific DNA recombinase